MNFEQLLLDLMAAIGQINFGTVVTFLLVSFIVFWVVVLGWVWTDSGDRVSSKLFRVLSVIIVAILLFPGLIIYLLIRPKATIEDIYWADLERRYLKFETTDLGDCPKCGFQLQPGFIVCPACGEKLKEKCAGCEAFIDKSWRYCPACGLERLTKKEAAAEILSQEISSEVMQDAVATTRQEIHDVVKSGRTRYAVSSGFVVFFGRVKETVKNIFTAKPKSVVNAKSAGVSDKKADSKSKVGFPFSTDEKPVAEGKKPREKNSSKKSISNRKNKKNR